MKTCTKCKQEKEVANFTKMKQAKDGLRPICKACDAAWRKANVVQRMQYQREYQAANKEYVAALNATWMKENAEHQIEMKRRYREEKPHVQAALNKNYQPAKRNAMPSWADKEKIAAFYKEAARLTRKQLTFLRDRINALLDQSPKAP